jgi:DNA-3-methyladenine glycosylase
MENSRLPQTFFRREAPELARELLGCILVRQTPAGITKGLIVETEAYSQEDAASHSYKGETARTAAMFGPAGHAYIYFTYGMHYCFNVVSGGIGHGQGVLIRALEPLEGIELMKQRRHKHDNHELCNGPAKLVQAMGITRADYGKALYKGNLYVEKSSGNAIEIKSGPRIGITKAMDAPWRFWIDGNQHVSR